MYPEKEIESVKLNGNGVYEKSGTIKNSSVKNYQSIMREIDW